MERAADGLLPPPVVADLTAEGLGPALGGGLGAPRPLAAGGPLGGPLGAIGGPLIDCFAMADDELGNPAIVVLATPSCDSLILP